MLHLTVIPFSLKMHSDISLIAHRGPPCSFMNHSHFVWIHLFSIDELFAVSFSTIANLQRIALSICCKYVFRKDSWECGLVLNQPFLHRPLNPTILPIYLGLALVLDPDNSESFHPTFTERLVLLKGCFDIFSSLLENFQWSSLSAVSIQGPWPTFKSHAVICPAQPLFQVHLPSLNYG